MLDLGNDVVNDDERRGGSGRGVLDASVRLRDTAIALKRTLDAAARLQHDDFEVAAVCRKWAAHIGELMQRAQAATAMAGACR